MERRRVVLLLALGILVSLTGSAFADSNIRFVRLSFVQGSVLIDQGAGDGFKHAILNMPVSSSTRIRTGDTGLAEVQFEEGATLRLAGGTSVLFQPLLLTSKGMRVSGISVGDGTVYITVPKAKHDRFFLNVAGMPLEISSKTHLRISADEKQVFIAIFKGHLFDTSSRVFIGQGDSLRIDLKTNAITDVARGIDPFVTDTWDRERERYYQSPAQYSSLATSSLALGPAGLPADPCFGMAPGSFGIWAPGCGYWDQGYYGYWNPYPYGITTPTQSTVSTRPKPNPPHPHGHPMEVTALPKTAVTLPVIAAYTETSRPDKAGTAMGIAPRPGSSPSQTFFGDRPAMHQPAAIAPSAGARWMPVSAISRPTLPVAGAYSGAYNGARSYTGSYSGPYSGSYSSGASLGATAPSRPASYSPPPSPAPSAPPAPVALGRPGK